jgi:protein SCO1/2
MSQRILLTIATGLALLALALGFFWHPGEASSVEPGGDFTLQSADGPVSLKDYRGKVVLVYFGYTFCPDICPTELTNTAAALKLLKPAEAGRVAVLFVSVDPERDTPAHLKEYTAFFHPAMVGVTGTPAEVAAVAKQYGVYYARQKTESAGGYVVDHSSEVYLVGPDGRLSGRLPHAAPPEKVAAEIRSRLG